MTTGDHLRHGAAVVWHTPPHPDRPCGCPKAPCGLSVPRPGCEPHRDALATLTMHIHPADRCRPGPEPHHAAARTRTDDEDLAIRRRDALDRMARPVQARLEQSRGWPS